MGDSIDLTKLLEMTEEDESIENALTIFDHDDLNPQTNMTEVHKSVGSLEDEAIVSLNVSQDERAFLNFIDDVLFENGAERYTESDDGSSIPNQEQHLAENCLKASTDRSTSSDKTKRRSETKEEFRKRKNEAVRKSRLKMKRKSQEKEIEIKALRNQVTKLQHELQIAYVKLDTIRDTLALQQPTT